MIDWTKIKHFKPSEFNYPDKMESDIIYLLDFLREHVGYPFVLHSDWRPLKPGAKKQSRHCFGEAVDGDFRGIPYRLAANEIVNIVENYTVDMVRMMHPEFMPGVDGDKIIGDLIGLGIYPHWNRPGIHLDTRGYMARWGAKYVWVECPSCHGTGIVLEGTNLTCAKCNRTGKVRKQEYITFQEAYDLIK